MDMYTILWVIALCITHFAAYCWGRDENKTDAPSEEAWIKVKEYEIDQRYLHLMLVYDKQAKERRREHEKDNSRPEG